MIIVPVDKSDIVTLPVEFFHEINTGKSAAYHHNLLFRVHRICYFFQNFPIINFNDVTLHQYYMQHVTHHETSEIYTIFHHIMFIRDDTRKSPGQH